VGVDVDDIEALEQIGSHERSLVAGSGPPQLA
jgi:hypothetical protein